MRWRLLLLSLLSPLVVADPASETNVSSVLPPEALTAFQAVEALTAKAAYGDAVQKIQEWLPRFQDRPEIQAVLLRNLAALYGRQKHYRHAAMIQEQALALHAFTDQDERQALYDLGQYYLAADDYAKAAEVLTHWSEKAAAPTAEQWVLLAELQLHLKQYPQAAMLMEKGIAQAAQPKEEWYQRLVAIYHETQDWQACMRILGILIQRSPDNPLYWNQLTGIYHEAGKDLHALAVRQVMCRRGMLKAPAEILQLAQIMRFRGMPARAAELVQRELDQTTLEANVPSLSLIADAWTDARELEKAAVAVERLAALTSEAENYHRLGQLYSELHDWGKARQAMLRALSHGKLKNPGGAYLLLGLAHYRLHDRAQAREAFVKALDTPTVRKTAQQWLDHLQRDGH